MQISYDRIPEHMRGAAQRYIEKGVPPGSFLTAVICNDLRGAFQRADHINAEAMLDWVSFFYNDVPGNCHGTPGRMKDWMEAGGALGREDEK